MRVGSEYTRRLEGEQRRSGEKVPWTLHLNDIAESLAEQPKVEAPWSFIVGAQTVEGDKWRSFNGRWFLTLLPQGFVQST